RVVDHHPKTTFHTVSPRTRVNRETEMPQRDPSEEEKQEEVSFLLKGYILPSLAKRGGQAMVFFSSPPLDVVGGISS
ncbi:MAG: hypothetical protein WKF53_14475, partial [Rubrobacter sp.]